MLNKSRGYDKVKEKEQEAEERQKGRISRFWLPPEGETKIIFLDDDPIIIEEHQLKIKGDWRNWFTCKRPLGETCIICDELGDSPYTVGFYTILDLAKYTDSKGNERKNTIKLLAAKLKALGLIKRYSQKREGLALWVCDVYRSGPDSFNIGDTFEFEEKTDWESIKKLNPEAEVINYEEVLAPKPDRDIKKILSRSTEGNLDSGVDEVGEDEVDF